MRRIIGSDQLIIFKQLTCHCDSYKGDTTKKVAKLIYNYKADILKKLVPQFGICQFRKQGRFFNKIFEILISVCGNENDNPILTKIWNVVYSSK